MHFLLLLTPQQLDFSCTSLFSVLISFLLHLLFLHTPREMSAALHFLCTPQQWDFSFASLFILWSTIFVAFVNPQNSSTVRFQLHFTFRFMLFNFCCVLLFLCTSQQWDFSFASLFVSCSSVFVAFVIPPHSSTMKFKFCFTFRSMINNFCCVCYSSALINSEISALLHFSFYARQFSLRLFLLWLSSLSTQWHFAFRHKLPFLV